MMQLVGVFAEFERSIIVERTSAGRTAAKARGVRFGRPPALTPHQQAEARQMLADGRTAAQVARVLGVSRWTIGRL
jgi:DNA invertase Pin-like site-specific DNA recombinase